MLRALIFTMSEMGSRDGLEAAIKFEIFLVLVLLLLLLFPLLLCWVGAHCGS
jgi:hypothetical protein